MLPRWATASNPEDATDDERIRRMTPDERLQDLVQILTLMETILAGPADREAELARREALPERWLELVEQSRRAREARTSESPAGDG